MRRVHASGFMLAAILVIAISAPAGRARADVEVFEKDGWSLYTKGLIAVHYQFMKGDNDPPAVKGLIVGNKLQPGGATDIRDQSITLSRLRSGFVGSQLAIGVNRTMSERTRVESLVAISLFDISSNRGQSTLKLPDIREAWAAAVTPVGTFKFGRMFSIYASAHAPVVLLAYQFGVGHPCALDQLGISCGSVGAGPQYAGFDAQMRYISPRAAGFEFQLAISDPLVGPSYQMSPYPRADADLNFDMKFGETTRLRAAAQGVVQEAHRVDMVTTMDVPPVTRQVLKRGRLLGTSGSAVVDAGPLSVGGGFWLCKGCGTKGAFEIFDAANPSAYDSVGDLRLGRGFFGNARVTLGGTSLTVGGGMSGLQSTARDKDPVLSTVSVINQAVEAHGVINHRIDTIVLTAEFMWWKNQWYFGEKQSLMFAGVGANYFW